MSLMQLHTHEVVEVCAKILYQVELQRSTLEQMWGFSVEAELIENADRQDELCCYVSRVEDKSVALQNGKLLISLKKNSFSLWHRKLFSHFHSVISQVSLKAMKSSLSMVPLCRI
jgi:hypothetical protein